MAETEQRFTLHARSRKIARIIGYPAGLGVLVAAVFFPFGDTQDRLVVGIICGFVGLLTLAWAWATTSASVHPGHNGPSVATEMSELCLKTTTKPPSVAFSRMPGTRATLLK